MKKQFTLLMIMACFAYNASAHEPKNEKRRRDGCESLKLTDEQRAALRAEHIKREESRIDLEAQAKRAHLELEKALANKDSDDKAIVKAAQASADAWSKLRTAEEVGRIETLVKVFKAGQREEALRCGLLGGHRHGRHGFGPGNGPRDHKMPPRKWDDKKAGDQ